MEADDDLLQPILKSEIAGGTQPLCSSTKTQPFPRVVELAGGDVEPHDGPPGADLAPAGRVWEPQQDRDFF